LGKRALFGVVARREEGDDASRWAAPGPCLLRAWRGGCPGRAARLGWGQAASLGQARQLGRAGVGGNGWLLGRARLPAGFRPTVSLVFKISFLFSNLFIICKIS
jgi:hypothetical protein